MIEFRDVSKVYEDTGTKVLDHFNLRIKNGEFVVLTGESGAGKSTILSLLLKETDYESGSIQVDREEVRLVSPKELPFYRRKIGVVFQKPALLEELTVYQNVELARVIVGTSAKESRKRIASLFSLLGIQELYHRKPAQLSGGERQKICLARALINNPPILLADEPTGNLDPSASGELFRLFELIHRQGTTIVLATHDREQISLCSGREINLDNMQKHDYRG